MPNKTKNLELYTFLENEPVDYTLINDNFEKVDSLITVVESSTKTATYNDGDTNNKSTTWHCLKYSDGTMEIMAKIPYVNELCTNGTESPYYSSITNIKLPVTFHPDKIQDLQVTTVSYNIAWGVIVSEKAISDTIPVRFLSLNKDTTPTVSRYLHIKIRGELM